VIRASAAVIAALLLASCGGRQTHESASPAPLNHADLRVAFRASFLHSCLNGVPGPAGQLYCTCTDERIESAFDDAELAHLSPQDPKFRAIARACAKKAGLTMRPGH
jgi:nitrous oxide reductase accessory protein NosL